MLSIKVESMPENQNCSYTYATFRIWGDNLDARAVTARLGIIPSLSFQRGDPGGPNGIWRRGYWAITTGRDRFNEETPADTGQSPEASISSTDLQVHIEWLLDRLDPMREELLAI